MPKKYNYYLIETGHFKVPVSLCFDRQEFKNILADYGLYNVFTKTEVLEGGIAETHYFVDGNVGIIILVFDLNECDKDPAMLAGVVAHEATHCACRVFEHIGEKVEDIGEESRAYLTEHIVVQITQAIINEKEKYAREANRKLLKQKSKKPKGVELQVDQLGDGGARPNSFIQGPAVVCGVENGEGGTVTTPTPRIC